jgi:hypothetical protein
VNSNSQSSPVTAPSGWQALFPNVVQFVLTPLILLLSGYFTANVLLSGHYTWARTTQTVALTLTVLILSREFVYKEQLLRTESPGRARSALLYSCAVPYVIGVVMMLALWAL